MPVSTIAITAPEPRLVHQAPGAPMPSELARAHCCENSWSVGTVDAVALTLKVPLGSTKRTPG